MYNLQLPTYTPQRLAVKLKPAAERLLLKSAHPWIYSDSIDKINKAGEAGDIAILYRQKSNKILGIGLYDPNSPIVIKMLHYYDGITVNREFFAKLIDSAFELRKPLLQTDTNSYRLIFGENDGLPGCIVDIYADVAVIKLYSAIWFPYLNDIAELVLETTQSSVLVLRMSRNLQAIENEHYHEGQLLYGTLENEVIHFKEHGVSFSANVIKGHKTGYFLDHRENRRKVGELAKGKTVLDVFAYAGGFSVHALVGGATEVVSVDISEQALELAKENALLNKFSGKHNTLTGDAFEILEELSEEQERFDIVVIDPPSFAKRESEVELAKKKYQRLAQLGASLLAPQGILILASCSSRITPAVFFEETDETLSKLPGRFKLLERTNHAIDHPVTFKEGAYLKCVYYQRI